MLGGKTEILARISEKNLSTKFERFAGGRVYLGVGKILFSSL
jgi:hypothetical protein